MLKDKAVRTKACIASPPISGGPVQQAQCGVDASFALSRSRNWQFLKPNSISTLSFGGVSSFLLFFLFWPFEAHSPRLFVAGSHTGRQECSPHPVFLCGELRGKSKPFPVRMPTVTEGKGHVIPLNARRPELTPNCAVRGNRWGNKRCPFKKKSFLISRGFYREQSAPPHLPRKPRAADRPKQASGGAHRLHCSLWFGKHV